MFSDVQIAYQARQAHELAGGEMSNITADQLAAAWKALGPQLADHIWIATLPDGTCAAYVELLHLDDAYMAQIWASSTQANTDILMPLLAHAEQRARDIERDEGIESVHLFAQATSFHPAIEQAIKRSGFDITSTYEHMTLALEQTPKHPDAIQGIDIRPFDVHHDAEAVYLADEEAFQDQRGHTPRTFERWRERLNLQGEMEKPSRSRIAWAAENVAGVALVEVIAGTGWIHHLSVRRPWRRRGLGEALMLFVLGEFHRNGVRSALLNVDAESLTNAHKLYRRLGFRPTHHYSNFQKIVSLA
ncbi:MAG TPA: GNAT family N-acetyltransferase [Ktedonobacterales bacterium]